MKIFVLLLPYLAMSPIGYAGLDTSKFNMKSGPHVESEEAICASQLYGVGISVDFGGGKTYDTKCPCDEMDPNCDDSKMLAQSQAKRNQSGETK